MIDDPSNPLPSPERGSADDGFVEPISQSRIKLKMQGRGPGELLTSPQPAPSDGLSRDDLLDLVSEALSDSIDMDWTCGTGARYVVDALIKEGIITCT